MLGWVFSTSIDDPSPKPPLSGFQTAENPDEFRRQKIEEYDYKYSNPFHASSNMLVHSVIGPRDTRPQLIKALRMLRNKQRPEMKKRHGNIPL